MAHIYSVQLSDGRTYDVSTEHYHGDHNDSTFKQHLLDVLKGTLSDLLARVIVASYRYKGRR